MTIKIMSAAMKSDLSDFALNINSAHSQLYDHLMNLSKSKIKYIITFILNYNNHEYEVNDTRTGNKNESQLCKLALCLISYRIDSTNDKDMIKFCDNILKLGKYFICKKSFKDLFSEEEGDDDFMTEE